MIWGIRLTRLSPIWIMPKGDHPSSRQNLINGRNKKNAQKSTLSLSPQARELIALVGGGNMSGGVEKLAHFFRTLEVLAQMRGVSIDLLIPAFDLFSRTYPDNSPYPQALKFYLQRRSASGDEEAQKHLESLESWEDVWK